MSEASSPLPTPAPGSARGWFRRTAFQSGGLGLGYALAVAVTAVSVYLALSAPGVGTIARASKLVLAVLVGNLLLIGSLAAIIGWRVLRLFVQHGRDAGTRLQLRFVTLFAGAAVVPAVVVALFFGLLVTRGVESWFSQRVRGVVETSAKVARSYVNEQSQTLGGDTAAMAQDMNRNARLLQQSPMTYGRILEGQASARSFAAAYVIDRDGRILARAQANNAPAFVAPPPASMKSSDNEVVVSAFAAGDLMRALYKLDSYPDAYLYVVRRMAPGILSYLEDASGSLTAYRAAEQSRQRIQSSFLLSYLETVLLVLVGAVWLGLAVAGGISAPIGRLVQAADLVAGGDLNARVESDNDPEEIAVLSRAFNRMTSDLQAQQEALRAASADAESRRQFIETVLAEVSAGVISLDPDGRVAAVNRQALTLLDLSPDQAAGRLLSEAAPELAEFALRTQGAEAAEEMDIQRRGETRRLRVRASAAADAGLVLTFDDITRLVAAQRNAAWKDVARRIAHEIKNPLTPIQLSAERLRRKYRGEITSDLETFDRCTDTIIRQVGDIGRMVDEFSAFARMPAPRFGPADATELLRQAVFAQRVANPEIDILMDEPVPEARLFCDAGMIGQALTNVLKNASEAVTARTLQTPGLKGRIRVSLGLDDEHVIYGVEDNGVGLPAKDRDRLTEPYVTTREKGTGLGLAIVKRILEDHEGDLQLSDAAELPGARVQLRLPRSTFLEESAPVGAALA